MYELVYCSVVRKNLSNEDIAAILETARNFNSKNNVTGCLLYYNNEFIQILEGDPETVRNLFSKIAKDQRHSDIRLLAEGYEDRRIFTDWNMAYAKVSKENMINISKDVFVDNFITFAELANKPTFPVMLFWDRAIELLEEHKD